MKIGIDIRNIGKKRTGDEVVFFNLTKNLAIIDQKNEYKLFTDITDKDILEEIKKKLEIGNKNNFEIIALGTKNTPPHQLKENESNILSKNNNKISFKNKLSKYFNWCGGKFSWNFWTLPKYLRKNPVDIYLTQYITPWFVPRKVKIATIIHDISFNFYPQFIKKSDLFFLKKLIPLSLKRADKIIAVSRFTQDEIIKYYKIDPKKTDWVYNAVSEDFLAQDTSEEKIKLVREKYKLPQDYILYLGTLQPRKNIPALIEAYALLKADSDSEKYLNSIKLVLAGGKSHNYDKLIDQTIEKSNLLKEDIIFTGFIDEEDKASVIKSAYVFCFPSFYEGFGIPVIEAMSVGTPAVVSDIMPHKEIFENAVSFFDPNLSGELSQALLGIIKNNILRNSLIIKGRDQAEKFSWQKTAEKLLKIFESM